MNYAGDIPPEYISMLGVVLSALIGYWGLRTKARMDKEMKAQETNTLQWQPFVGELRDYFQGQIDELKTEIEELKTDIKERQDYEAYVTEKIYDQRSKLAGLEVSLPRILTFPEWRHNLLARKPSD